MFRIILFTLLFSLTANAKYKVAIIDTGLPVKTKLPFCPSDHADFTGTDIYDENGHATNIAALITREATGVDFCIISVKYFHPSKTAGSNLLSMRQSIDYAIDMNVDVINISGGGEDYSREEALIIQKALNKGIKIIAAAGNGSQDFSKNGCKYYPACYDDRIMAVGCMKKDFTPCDQSNFGGKIKIVAIGQNQKGSEGVLMTGTSQATAIATGIYLKALDLSKKKK